MARVLTQLIVAVVAGPIIVWMMTIFVLEALSAAGVCQGEANTMLSLSTLGVIGGAGALAALVSVWLLGGSPLPAWVRQAFLGGLAGVAAVVIMTLAVAHTLGEHSSKEQAWYLRAGLLFGVPVGLSVGLVAGLIWMPAPMKTPPSGPIDTPITN